MLLVGAPTESFLLDGHDQTDQKRTQALTQRGSGPIENGHLAKVRRLFRLLS